MDLAAIQSALRERNIDAWLFYDHHHRDPIAYRVLGLPASLMVTRRWFYLIPAEGEPVKLVHKIEAGHLDSLPGKNTSIPAGRSCSSKLKVDPGEHRDMAMQYSPNNIVFTISLVDGGTIDLLRGLGKNVVSSADLVAQFESTWSDEQIQSHFAARDSIDSIVAAAFKEIGRRVRNGGTKEHEIQQWFMEAFARENLLTDDPPIVAVNANAGNPHYEPHASHPVPIREGDLVLLDVWGKKNTPGAVYYDITWMGFVGRAPSSRMQRSFRDCARRARCRSEDGARRDQWRDGTLPDGKWTVPRAGTSRKPATAIISFIAPDIPSAPTFIPTAPTWTIWKFTTSGRFFPTPASRSSPASTCRSLACAAK